MHIKSQTFKNIPKLEKKCLFNYILFIFRYISLDNDNFV